LIAVIDYELGNLRSVQKSLELVGNKDVLITSDPETVMKADRVVLPGVGAFGDCTKGLSDAGLTESVFEFIKTGKPILGICVGMQMMFEKSYEFGEHAGLGIFKGEVKKFPDEIVKKGMKIPHMGWNTIIKNFDHPVLEGIETGEHFYFVHSYYATADREGVAALECDYGVRFTAMAARDNIVATQFHPEKSQKMGLKLLENFSSWNC